MTDCSLPHQGADNTASLSLDQSRYLCSPWYSDQDVVPKSSRQRYHQDECCTALAIVTKPYQECSCSLTLLRSVIAVEQCKGVSLDLFRRW